MWIMLRYAVLFCIVKQIMSNILRIKLRKRKKKTFLMLQLSEAYAWVSKWLTLLLWAGNLMSLVLSKRGPLDNVQDTIACLFIMNY